MDKNRLIMEFGCDARNEAVARVVVAAMLTRTNPTLSEVEDVKTAVSEAVTSVQEAVYVYILYALSLRKLEQTVQMCNMAVYAAIRKKSV